MVRTLKLKGLLWLDSSLVERWGMWQKRRQMALSDTGGAGDPVAGRAFVLVGVLVDGLRVGPGALSYEG